jgi:hypothetical protein
VLLQGSLHYLILLPSSPHEEPDDAQTQSDRGSYNTTNDCSTIRTRRTAVIVLGLARGDIDRGDGHLPVWKRDTRCEEGLLRDNICYL